MAVTRIKNNQITDSTINAAAKVQGFTITGGLLANNLTYGSDFTVQGNLVVQGNTTTIDTNITTIEDPVIVLASTQTGSPTVDIGFIGERGTSNNIAFVWQESSGEFITAFTSTAETNTTITVSSYANFKTLDANITGNLTVAGTSGFTGNMTTGNIFVGTSKTIDAGNNIIGNVAEPFANTDAATKAYVDSQISGSVSFDISDGFTTETVTNGDTITFSGVANETTVTVSGTDTVTVGLPSNVIVQGSLSANSMASSTTISATGNVTGGNVLTGGVVSASGTVTGGNIATAGTVSATGDITGNAAISALGNVTGGNVLTGGLVSATGNVTGGNLNTGGVITATGNVTGGNFFTGGLISATGNITGGNIISGNAVIGNVQVTGDITVNSITSNTYVSAIGNVIGGNVTTAGLITATGNVTGGNLNTGGAVSATGTITSAANVVGGNITTAGDVAATGLVSGGNVAATGNVSATGNIIGGNVVTTTLTTASGDLTINAAGGDLDWAGSGNIRLGNRYINDLADPVNNQDGATKYYVDTMVSTAISYHQPVLVATTDTLANTTGGTITYNNGTGGVGATLTTTGAFNLIDTANVQTANTRILVKNEANAALNGVYVWSNATVITRSDDTDTYGAANIYALGINDYFFVQSGNVNKGSAYVVDGPSGTITFGTSNITFAQFSSSQTYSANTAAGMILNGTVFSAKVDNDTTAFDGTGNIIVKSGANLVSPNIGNAVGNSITLTGNGTVTAVTVSASGNVIGGNINTAGKISATGNIDSAGNIYGANILTGGIISATGNITTAGYYYGNGFYLSGVANAESATKLVNGTTEVDIPVANGNVTFDISGTSNVIVLANTGAYISGVVSVSGNVTGGNIDTAGQIAASGNITGGNLLTGGLISATGNVSSGNLTTGIISATGNINGTGAVFSGNVTAANFFGNIAGNIDAGGSNTQVQFNDDDLLNGSAAFTFDKASNVMTVGGTIQGTTVSATGNVIGGNVNTAGLVTATGNVTGGNVNTAGLVTATGNVTGGNFLTGGLISATGNVTAANVILTSGTVDGPAAGIIAVNGSGLDTDFSVSGDTVANVFYVDAGTGTASFGNSAVNSGAIVAFNAPNSVIMPVGNTAQRPGSPTLGMLRFNTAGDALEVYTSGGWEDVGVPAFTVIVDDQFNGDGSQVNFTLSQSSTTAGVVVSINGVVQIPTTAYSVTGTTLTFTEAPLSGDLIDVRIFTTTTSVNAIENASGNAVVETLDTSATVLITGNVIPSANVTFNLGSNTAQWNDLYLSGNTIYLGGLQLQASGNTFVVYTADGVTQANIDVGSVDVSGINSGTTTIGITAPNGNAYVTVGGSADRLVVSTAGANVQGTLGVTGTITGGNIATGGTVSATGNITGGNLNVSGNIVDTGALHIITGSNGNIVLEPNGTGIITTPSAISAVGNVVGGNFITGGYVYATGNINGAHLSLTNDAVILGNLTVNGTTTTLNSNTVTTNDLIINMANNAATAAAANGGGIGVGPVGATYATLTYNSTGNTWTISNGATVAGIMSASGNVTGGNVLTAGQVSATGNVTGGNILTSGIVSATGSITSGADLSLSGNIVDSGALIVSTGSNGNITLSPNGTGVIIATKDILNGQANGVGNIGNATGYFNTIFAKATSAQYADLAEKYVADASYAPGTVVSFGGDKEVTVTNVTADTRVAGVISTNPSYVMNAGLDAEFVVTVALTGRVPTRVTGTVRKGDLMVSAGGGLACASTDPKVGTVIGKALEDFDGDEGVIEVVVGRF